MIWMKNSAIILILISLSAFVNAIQWDNEAYWNLDQIHSPVLDVTNNGNDGKIVGDPLTGAKGKINKSINFNNSRKSNNYINTTDIDLNNSASYSLWVIQKEGEDDTTYLSKRDRWGGTTIEIISGNSLSFCVRTVSEESEKGWTPIKQLLNTLSRIFLGKGIKEYTFWGLTELEKSCTSINPSPSVNEWHHIVAVYDRSENNMSLYVDGEYMASTIHRTGLPMNNKNYVIGANAMGSEGFDGGKGGSEGANGYIDEVGIWGRALKPEEISKLYNSGEGLKFGS